MLVCNNRFDRRAEIFWYLEVRMDVDLMLLMNSSPQVGHFAIAQPRELLKVLIMLTSANNRSLCPIAFGDVVCHDFH